MGTILYFAADLVWATRIKALATDMGLPARPVRNLDMLHARLADTEVTGVLLDLDDGPTALGLIAAVREAGSRVPVVCWGPHVERELFEAARRAGADEVLTRGTLHAGLADVLTRLATPRA